ncbi:MAG: PIG-L family deacetylase, partial [Opitutae bacterium]|nr:PIG-L family deacetylase [Opitutae bacterium]
GGHSPSFSFATLYRVNQWNQGKMSPAWPGGKLLASEENSKEMLFSK